MNTTKICKRCGKEKSIDEFYDHKFSRDKHGYWCKECTKECSRDSYIRNKDKKVRRSKPTLLGQTKRIKSIYPVACLVFGKEHQANKFLEELLEAALAYVRCLNAKAEDKHSRFNEFSEEAADVFVTLIQQVQEIGLEQFLNLLDIKVTKFNNEVVDEYKKMDDLK